MKLIILIFNLVLFLELSAQNKAVPFGKQKSESGITHSFLICGNKTVLLNEKSEILWQTKGYGRDGFVLKNGNILVSVANVAKEISREGKLVWSYQLSKGNKELGTCVRLENGNTLVVERGVKPQLLEVGDFMRNDIFKNGGNSNSGFHFAQEQKWWKVDELTDRIDGALKLLGQKLVECTLGRENNCLHNYVTWFVI